MSMYTGVGGSAKKVAALYVGVGETARKVSVAYAGVEGLAKKVWAAQADSPVSHVGYAPDMQNVRYSPAVMSTAHHVFAGGGYGSKTVDAYDTGLVRTSVAELLYVSFAAACGVAGNYGIVGGGMRSTANANNRVFGYDADLVQTEAAYLNYVVGYPMSGSFQNRMAMAGGSTGSRTTNEVYTYSSSLAKASHTALTTSRYHGAFGVVENRMLIAGGASALGIAYPLKTVEVYGSDFVKGATVNMSVARQNLTALSLNEHCFLCGGQGTTTAAIASMDVFDRDLVLTTLPMPIAILLGAGIASKDGTFGMISGGAATFNNSVPPMSVSNVSIVYYDDLTYEIVDPLPVGRSELGAGIMGDYFLMVGGRNLGNASAQVDKYRIN